MTPVGGGTANPSPGHSSTELCLTADKWMRALFERIIAMNDFFVLVTLYAKLGREEELRKKLIALVEPSRKDAGNLRYELFVDQDDPRRFAFMEHWDSPEAQLKHHTETDHIHRFEEQKSGLVEKVELFYRLTSIA